MYWYYKLLLGLILILVIGFFIEPYFSQVSSFFSEEEDFPVKEVSQLVSPAPDPLPVVEEEIVETPTVDVEILKQIKNIEKFFEQEKYVKVLESGSFLLDDPLFQRFSPEWYRVARCVSKANSIIAFSNIPYDKKESYVVRSGDSLSKIAKGKTTAEAIAKANGISNSLIFPDQSLHFFAGIWRLEAYKSEYILIVYHNNKFFKYYKIGTGKNNRTPVGEFVIYDKIINPPYWKKGRRIPFGDVENPLGTRWMALRDNGRPTLKGYGIHGTKEPNSVGKSSSQGCLRMLNKNVEELFDLLPHFVKLSIKD